MKAGFAKLDITPPVGIELAGYGYFLKRMSNALHDPLFARALALESEGTRLLIISCDLIGFGNDFVEDIKSTLEGCTGIPADAILIHCTHTHSGPATAIMRGCGVMDPAYVRDLKPELVKAGVEAIDNLTQVGCIRHAETEFEGIGFNRTTLDVKPIDHTVCSLFIERLRATPIILSNYACHPVVNGVNDAISADYPGELSCHLEKQGYESIFLNGFSGDINPNRPLGYETTAKHGKRIADVVLQDRDRAVPLSDTTLRFCTRQIRLALDVPDRSDLIADLLSAKAALEANPQDMVMLKEVSWLVDALAVTENPDFPAHVDTYLQTIAIGDLTLIAFPGETFTAFGLTLREKFPHLKLLTVNTANGLVGYIPTADEFDIHGYASHDAPRIYNIFAFIKGFGEDICEQASELIAEISAN